MLVKCYHLVSLINIFIDAILVQFLVLNIDKTLFSYLN